MSTPNFRTMDQFPLYARDFEEEFKRCTCCGEIYDGEQEECEECGCELETEYRFDYCECEYVCEQVEDALSKFNCDLLFHKVSLESGHYSGVQLYVDAEHDLDEGDYDNEDCWYYFDLCRSKAYRKYTAEKRKIVRFLEKIAGQYGFEELVCTAVFSNGEAVYDRVESSRARLIAAACG